jgi:antitoxin component YwqK of YwqJK toxin-antitoxin module
MAEVVATYFYESGKKKVDGNWKNGKEEGKWIFYFESGGKEKVGEFKQGKKEGVWILYNENTEKPTVKEVYQDGILIKS